MNYRRKYQKGRETEGDALINPDGSMKSQDEFISEYSAGQGGPPPGIDQEGMGGPKVHSANQSVDMRQQIVNLTKEELARRNAMKQQMIQEQLQLLQIRNQMLEQQNQLLQTKIQKDDMINQARTIPSNLQKAITSPKKMGGSNSPKKRGRGKTIIMSSNMGGVMKRGGQCGLPGGRHDMKSKRR